MEDKSSVLCFEEAKNPENLDVKKSNVTNKLQKRDDERNADLLKRKEEKETTTAANETVDYFLEKFKSAKSEIENNLQKADTLQKEEIADHLDSISINLQKLQKISSDHALFLPAYDVQKAQAVLSQLQTSIQEKRDQLIPKKKFAFKSKKKAGEKSSADVKRKAEPKKEVKVALTDCNFADESSKSLVKTADEATNKDVALTRLSDCNVKIYGSPSAIHVDKLSKCVVLCGPVSGSIFINDCTDCVFVVPCQQGRIHNTNDTEFYIHVTSRAIIEDCQRVFFAPYNWSYDGLDEHYKISGLDQGRNNWNDVDDFNWLASDTPSPNWAVLEESKRKMSWD